MMCKQRQDAMICKCAMPIKDLAYYQTRHVQSFLIKTTSAFSGSNILRAPAEKKLKGRKTKTEGSHVPIIDSPTYTGKAVYPFPRSLALEGLKPLKIFRVRKAAAKESSSNASSNGGTVERNGHTTHTKYLPPDILQNSQQL